MIKTNLSQANKNSTSITPTTFYTNTQVWEMCPNQLYSQDMNISTGAPWKTFRSALLTKRSSQLKQNYTDCLMIVNWQQDTNKICISLNKPVKRNNEVDNDWKSFLWYFRFVALHTYAAAFLGILFFLCSIEI